MPMVRKLILPMLSMPIVRNATYRLYTQDGKEKTKPRQKTESMLTTAEDSSSKVAVKWFTVYPAAKSRS